ncbi:hypothetical protein SNOUR_42850 [Streptomyces noursei ATCC 11455]|nr:hypothetical protein SNOUR_42850 [Streptomyces noursei ATCC 11455]
MSDDGMPAEKTCPDCGGVGKIPTDMGDEIQCSGCMGTGTVVA